MNFWLRFSRRGALARSIHQVVSSGNCSGCGLCTLISPHVTMTLSDQGFLRPTVDAAGASVPSQVTTFRRTCPGRTVTAPRPDSASATVDPILGRVEAAWSAWATDPEARHLGSSGGVLTALAAWLTTTGEVASVVAAAPDSERAVTTTSVTVTSRAEALRSAGSRYAPVATLAQLRAGAAGAVIAKPCEASALSAWLDDPGRSGPRPLLMSFFCAGTPSQAATDRLVRMLGVEPDEVTSLRYRGHGWPGEFAVTGPATERTMSYDESWGHHLGRQIQARCKICVDGTGEHADLAVGDFWESDEQGYPAFDDAPGRSVLIARTQRGRELIERAIAEAVIEVGPVELDQVTRVQPLQRDRRRQLPGRLIGRVARRGMVPRYRGYRLRRWVAADPRGTIRAARATFRRGRPSESTQMGSSA